MPNPKLPNSQHALKGTIQPCRHDGYVAEDPIENVFPEPPEWLSSGARDEWFYVRSCMEGKSIIRLSDRNTLAHYCCLAAEIAAFPSDFSSSKLAQMRGLASSLYLDPAARAKLPATEPAKKKNDFSEFN